MTLVVPAFASAAEVKLLQPARAWEMAEFRLENAPTAANNFDPEQVRIDATFTTASGATTSKVPAFWYEDFSRALVNGAEVLTPQGKGEWRLRFTPSAPGNFAVRVTAQLGNDAPVTIATFSFHADDAAEAKRGGWVRLSADKSGFETSEGNRLPLSGENVCWSAGQGTYDFERWFDHMQQSGQNYARIWLCPWSLAIEHTPDALTKYHQDAAWQLDTIMHAAEARGIYIQLCFDHHGMYSVSSEHWGGNNNFWTRNPYSKIAGGPCDGPNDFFTNAKAREIYQKRLRYLIARYAYSSHLLAWEFFNEIDNIYQPEQSLVPKDVMEWHRVMEKWIRENDPFHHLVTSSLTGGSDRAEFWTLPEMDFAAYHSYDDSAPARMLAHLSQDFVTRYKKPVMIGEFGTSAQSWHIAGDPHLRGFRQALWGSTLGGSTGTAMPWWWEDMEKDNVYPLYTVLYQVLRGAGWSEAGWTPIAIAAEDFAPSEVGAPLPNQGPFTAQIALADFRRIPLSGKLALANPLAAERATEQLSRFLIGKSDPALHRPIQIAANVGADAKFSFNINSVAGPARIVIDVDGQEKLNLPIADRDGKKTVNHEIDQLVSFDVAPGRHVITISNEGVDWAHLENMTLSAVLPSEFAGGWTFHAESVALRNDTLKRGVVYLNSPYVAWPAGALRYNPPTLEGQQVKLPSWPAGTFDVQWINPVNGNTVATAQATTVDSILTLAVPPMNDDVVAVVRLSASR
ncbi:MAG TPA: cellulase family glycosylhydrolase [Opitutaceae bacterium]|nr:cellulase family glycosylhydrolase [Opitutaceae bacterium]